MPRCKPIDTGMKMLPIDLSVQLLPGTFEHALSHLLDHELDLRVLDERFKNAESGAPAYAPSVMLKVIPKVSSLGCGWAMLQILAGENPAPVTASHGPGIEPCRCGGNTVFDA